MLTRNPVPGNTCCQKPPHRLLVACKGTHRNEACSPRRLDGAERTNSEKNRTVGPRRCQRQDRTWRDDCPASPPDLLRNTSVGRGCRKLSYVARDRDLD